MKHIIGGFLWFVSFGLIGDTPREDDLQTESLWVAGGFAALLTAALTICWIMRQL